MEIHRETHEKNRDDFWISCDIQRKFAHQGALIGRYSPSMGFLMHMNAQCGGQNGVNNGETNEIRSTNNGNVPRIYALRRRFRYKSGTKVPLFSEGQ